MLKFDYNELMKDITRLFISQINFSTNLVVLVHFGICQPTTTDFKSSCFWTKCVNFLMQWKQSHRIVCV